VRALEKDGWTVEPHPIQIVTELRDYYVDIEASRYANGSRQTILLAEVNCFPDPRTTVQIYIALGQYIAYRAILDELGRITPIYLAIPDDVYDTFFEVAIKRAIRDNHIKLIIVNLAMEKVVQWMD
jgi:XisH protein